MKGTVTPRPSKKVVDKRTGKLRTAPLRPYEEWTDPKTGKTVRAGAEGSTWTWRFCASSSRRHHSEGGFATKVECEEALAKAIIDLGHGDTRALAKPEARPVGDYLFDWIDARTGLKPSTEKSYRDAIRVWIAPRDDKDRYRLAPYLGELPLQSLTEDHLTRLYAHLKRQGGRITIAERKAAAAERRQPVGPPLGSRSIHLAHTVLRMALADAVEAGKLPFSPVERIPKRQRPTHTPVKQAERVWTPGQVQQFLTARRADRLYAFWCLGLDTGARRGELAALSWPDVDLDEGTVTIRDNRVVVGREIIKGETKSRKSRTIDLDPRTVEILRTWKTAQTKDRLAAGRSWTGGDPGMTGYVFTTEVGAPFRSDWLSDRFERLQKGLKLPYRTLHSLRHTSATIALLKGVAVHVVLERLGHSKVSTTLDIYAHVIRTQASDAAAVIGSAIYGDQPAAAGEGGAR